MNLATGPSVLVESWVALLTVGRSSARASCSVLSNVLSCSTSICWRTSCCCLVADLWAAAGVVAGADAALAAAAVGDSSDWGGAAAAVCDGATASTFLVGETGGAGMACTA